MWNKTTWSSAISLELNLPVLEMGNEFAFPSDLIYLGPGCCASCFLAMSPEFKGTVMKK